MKNSFLLAVAFLALTVVGAPEITNVSVSQDASRRVTVKYDMPDDAAVVTVEFKTNGVAVSSAAACGFEGDADALVAAGMDRTFTWQPRSAMPEMKLPPESLQVVLTAWDVNNLPPYMVLDLTATNRVRYYASAEALPGGQGVTNILFKKDRLLMFKAPACNATFRMGSAIGETANRNRDYVHNVTFTEDFYIGVYELTQGQLNHFVSNNNYEPVGECYPVNKTSYDDMRGTQYSWPGDGHKVADTSLLKLMRGRTGVELDLPTDAQWEFACRAGCPGRWNNGEWNSAAITNVAVCSSNGGNAPHVVGTKQPNSWGLYDFHGNVWEWCLDWNQNVLTNDETDPKGPSGPLDGNYRVVRGGSYYRDYNYCRAGHRNNNPSSTRNKEYGIRLACPAVAR